LGRNQIPARNGIGVETHERRIGSLVAERMDFLYVGLPALDAVQYLEGDNWLGVALSALMRIPRDRVAWLGAEALRRLQGSPLTDHQKYWLGECVEAYLPLTAEQKRELEGLLQTKTYSEVKAVNLTTFEKGVLKGQEEGREKAMAGMIRGLLFAVEIKFGGVDHAVEVNLNALRTEEEVQTVQTLLRSASTSGDFLAALTRR